MSLKIFPAVNLKELWKYQCGAGINMTLCSGDSKR